MNTAELIERVRMTCFFTAATHPDYTDAWILNELYDQECQLFTRNIINARAGYWLTIEQRSGATPGNSQFRLPSRACAGGLEGVELAYSAGDAWTPMRESTESQAYLADLPAGQTAQPSDYVLRGDKLVLLPTPPPFNAFRFKYYRRPSVLALPQDGRNGSTERGLVISSNPVAGTIAINTQPFNMLLTAPVVLTGFQPFDVVRNDYSSGFSEIVFSGIADFTTTTLTPTTVTTGSFLDIINSASNSTTRDYVRFQDQAEYPQLPREFHRSLADAVSVKILTELGLDQKASALASQLASDLNRFQDLITPRTKNSPKDIVAPSVYGGGNRRGWSVRFP